MACKIIAKLIYIEKLEGKRVYGNNPINKEFKTIEIGLFEKEHFPIIFVIILINSIFGIRK